MANVITWGDNIFVVTHECIRWKVVVGFFKLQIKSKTVYLISMEALMFQRKKKFPSLFNSLDNVINVAHITNHIFLCKLIRDRHVKLSDRETEKYELRRENCVEYSQISVKKLEKEKWKKEKKRITFKWMLIMAYGDMHENKYFICNLK